MPNEHLQRIFRHNSWANKLIMEACRDLTEDQLHVGVAGTYGELGATLAHLAAGEAGYVWRFDQDPDRFQWDEDDPVPSVATLAKVLEQTGARFVELAAATPDDQILSYMVEGEQRTWPAWVILGQVIDHGREHRSHAATVLTQLGIEPPDIDMWSYAMALQAGETKDD
jgi:uncharacterized damage-inducible protein DinB